MHFTEQPFSPSDSRSGQDTFQSAASLNHGFANGGTIVRGRILDVVAHARTYKVACDRGFGVLACCDASHSSLGLLGARSLNTYALGTQVLVYYHPQATFAVILCAFPDWIYDARQKLADAVVQGANVGMDNDQVHYTPLQLGGQGIVDFSANRPADSLHLGEWGAMSATGGRVFLDDFIAQLGIDEVTGVTALYFDQLLRVAGHNLQMRAAGLTFEGYDDEGEWSSVRGVSPYPWELLGGNYAAAVLSAELSIDDATGFRSRVEPSHDDQIPTFRSAEYEGYLGQGGKRVTQIPLRTSAVRRLSDSARKLIGVLDEVRGLDGAFGLRSAHSISLVKHPAIPAPQQTKRQEDPAGDSVVGGNYASCGLYSDASLPAHEISGEPANANAMPHVVEAAAVLDHVAYLFNWKGLHAFHYHNRDWYTPDESDLVDVPQTEFSSLASQHFLDAPAFVEATVDDRYGLTKYYLSTAGVSITPQGSISIVDAWGSEIRMSGGHVEIHAPGDLVRSAGRSIIDRAGYDAIYIANNCLESVANWGNVSIKANENVMVTGGNNRCGGILLQSLSSTIAAEASTAGDPVIGGIVLRAKHSAVSVLAGDVYIATNGWGDASAGRIVLDCGSNNASNSNIIMRADQVVTHAHSNIAQVIGPDDAPIVNEYWKAYVKMGTKFVVNAETFLWGCATVYGNLGVNGVIVSPLDNESGLTFDNDQIVNRNTTTTVSASKTEAGFLATTDVVALEFSFRPSTAYVASDYAICAPVWHQKYASGLDTIGVWHDQAFVDDGGHASSTFPGYTKWHTDHCYGEVALTMFDAADGVAVNRSSAIYETPALGAVTYVALEGHWPVITNP